MASVSPRRALAPSHAPQAPLNISLLSSSSRLFFLALPPRPPPRLCTAHTPPRLCLLSFISSRTVSLPISLSPSDKRIIFNFHKSPGAIMGLREPRNGKKPPMINSIRAAPAAVPIPWTNNSAGRPKEPDGHPGARLVWRSMQKWSDPMTG